MAAPAITSRVFPTGIRLDCGYQSLVSVQGFTSLAIYEKTIQPPAMDGGTPIVTTTMLNECCETKAAQRLRGHGDLVIVAAYDPHVLYVLDTHLINQNTCWTIEYPEGSAWAFWAYLQKVESAALERDKQPEMTLTVTVTNYDTINCVEACPTYYNGTGSCVQADYANCRSI